MADVTVNLSGLASTGSPGTLSETGDANVPITGVSSTGSPGSPSITGDANVTPLGRSSTTHAGSPIVLQDTEVLLLGLQAFADPGVLFNNLTPDFMCCEGPWRLLSIFRARIPIPPPPSGACTFLAWSYLSAVTSLSLHCLCWSPELGIMVAGGNASTTATSPDGITWTSHAAATNAATNGIAWSPQLGIFVGAGQVGRTRTSTDGISWTENATVAPFRTFNSACWSPELGLFAITTSTATAICVWTSPDGVNWTGQTTPITSQSCRQIIWVPPGLLTATGLFVICGSAGLIMTSPDGVTWTIQTTPNSYLWTSIAYSPTLAILVAVSGTRTGTDNRTISSIDGVTWTLGSVPSDVPNDYTFAAIDWSPTLLMFAAVGAGSQGGFSTGSVMTSVDGIDFHNDTFPGPNRWTAIAGGQGLALFVAVNDVDSGGGFLIGVCNDSVNHFSDDFDRSDGAIGANWDVLSEAGDSVPEIVSRLFKAIIVAGPADDSNGLYRVANSIISDSAGSQKASIRIAPFSLGASCTVTVSAYIHLQSSTDGAFIQWTNVDGGSETLTLSDGNGHTSSTGVTLAPGNVIGIETDGVGGLIGTVNGVSTLTLATQGPWSGTPGFAIGTSGTDDSFVEVDDFYCEF